MRPDQEANQCNTKRRHRNPAISVQRLSNENRYQLRNNAQTRQNKDINRRVRIEPKQMLEKDRVAAFSRVKKTHTEQTLEHNQLERETDRLGCGQGYDGCSNCSPNQNRHAKCYHALRTHPDRRCKKIESAKNRRPPSSENAEKKHLHSHRSSRGERRITRPTSVKTTQSQA